MGIDAKNCRGRPIIMSYTLLVDTSTTGFALALVGEVSKSIEWKKVYTDKYGAAQFLVSSLKEGLNDLEITAKDISRVVVGRGPGSFTGIKIGLSFVTGLYAGKPEIKFAGVSSLEVMSRAYKQKFGGQPDPLTIAIKATKAHGFCSVWSGNSEKVESFSFDVDNHEHSCYGTQEFVSCGEWSEFADAITSVQGKGLKVLEASDVLFLTIEGMHILLKNNLLSFEDLPPQAVYLKKSTAEERLENKK